MLYSNLRSPVSNSIEQISMRGIFQSNYCRPEIMSGLDKSEQGRMTQPTWAREFQVAESKESTDDLVNLDRKSKQRLVLKMF